MWKWSFGHSLKYGMLKFAWIEDDICWIIGWNINNCDPDEQLSDKGLKRARVKTYNFQECRTAWSKEKDIKDKNLMKPILAHHICAGPPHILEVPVAIGLYRTSRPVQKSDKFSKSGLSRNRTFSLPDTGLLTLWK